MNALKFTLYGKTAFFKKPDVNTFYYFTYGNIHKVALLGIMGAINGYAGYNQQVNNKNSVYPEFYEKLKDIKVAIAPQNYSGYISKKIQVFNNSVGYASKEQGGNLIIKEQWLENPKWDIYLLIQGEVEKELTDRIMNSRFEFIPYLGKNDHVANITDKYVLTGIKKVDNPQKIHSLFIKRDFEFVKLEDDFDDIDSEYIEPYKYEEMLPVGLEEKTNKYILDTFVYTNSDLKCLNECSVYECGGKLIYFF